VAELFRFDDVTLRVGEAVVLDRVDATISDEGITAVVGPSGSGKSTLLRCCNLLEAPTSGTVSFRGASLKTLDPLRLRRQVAMVFQRPTAFPGTVADNLRVADPSLTDDGSAVLLDRVGLPPGIADQVADSLSGGEAQRMTLARALATRPEVLLADESTSGLDDDAKATLERLVRGLADGGMPVVWVTHEREQVKRIADSVLAVDRGRVVEA
jgi:putative ABC transport system ATP-binding protein